MRHMLKEIEIEYKDNIKVIYIKRAYDYHWLGLIIPFFCLMGCASNLGRIKKEYAKLNYTDTEYYKKYDFEDVYIWSGFVCLAVCLICLVASYFLFLIPYVIWWFYFGKKISEFKLFIEKTEKAKAKENTKIQG